MPTIIAIRAGGQSGGSKLEKAVFDYNVGYVVQTDEPGEGMLAVSITPGLPQEGDCYSLGTETDLGAICRSRAYRQVSKFLWEVTCQYSSEFEDPADNNRNPLLRPAKRRISFERVEEFPAKDKDDKPYTNSAREPYEASVVATARKRPVLTITRNEAIFPIAIALDYADAINSDVFYGYEADHVLLDDLQAEEAIEGDPDTGVLHYWIVTYKFIFDNREKGFLTEALDQGHYYYYDLNADGLGDVGTESSRSNNTAFGGVQTTDLILLDGTGNRLTAADIATASFHYNEFRKYERKPFGPLGLEW